MGKKRGKYPEFEHKNGGERGIRTLERENPLTIFETVAFGHSAISPLEEQVITLHCNNITCFQWFCNKNFSIKLKNVSV